MFNTTTIPTKLENNSGAGFLNLFCILSTSAVLAISMMELFLYRLREKNRQLDTNDSSDEDETETYCHKYEDVFEALSMRDISPEELLQLNTKIVREEVAPKVEVILTFDKGTETFWYYTDHLKEISYDILETVAQKFAIEHDCKAIYLQADTSDPVTSASETVTSASETVTSASETEQSETEKAPTKSSVFAKFKDYNTGGKGSTPNFTSVLQVIEQMNHFRYRGKICDYEATLKSEEKIKNNMAEPQLDYATYKKLLEKKTD
jgi:hypothetical protein